MTQDDRTTLDYYNKNANTFAECTINVEFTDIQDRFLKLLPEGAHILDFGCGSGRDTKYFLSNGFLVDATDGSEEMCRIASELTGISVRQMLFSELDVVDVYDGIWACSSILHCPKEELKDVIRKMIRATKDGGVVYTSFKYGDFEGERNGRYFTNFTTESFHEFMRDFPELGIEQEWVSADVRPGRGDEKWLNLILRKNGIDETLFQVLAYFYEPWFPTCAEARLFVMNMLESDLDNRIPYQMIFQVQRFVSLAETMRVIECEDEGLVILFFRTCMESLEYLGREKKKDKAEFFKVFAQCFSKDGKDYILGNILNFSVEEQINDVSTECMHTLTIDDFLNMIKVLRDKAAHDGICAATQLFARDEDSIWCSSIETDEKMLKTYPYEDEKRIRHYSFTTTLQFDKFKYYFVEACICFIQEYVKSKISR